jgi:hypothetical protein
MKSQIKALAAVEGNFSFASCIYDLIFPEFLSFQIAILVYHWAEKLEKKILMMLCMVIFLSPLYFVLPKTSSFVAFSLMMFMFELSN